MSALINMPMPMDVNQVRALIGGTNYYRNFLPDLSKRLRPINSLLRKGVKFAFPPAMEKLVREILAELATPPIMVFPNWDAAADGSRPFHVYCDACIDGFGIVWALKHLRGYLWGTKFRIFSDHKALESIGKVGTIMLESRGGSSSSPRSITHSSTAKEARTATPTSCPACQSVPRNMICLLYTSPSPRDRG